MKEQKKQAWINWSQNENKWILRLWIDNEWLFSKSWAIKEENEDGIGYVSERLVIEIARLQAHGYSVKVTC